MHFVNLTRFYSTILLALFTFTFSFGQCFTDAENADSKLFEYCHIKGKVVSVYQAIHSYGKPTFLNFEREFPNQPFSVIIWHDDLDRFSASPEDLFLGKEVSVYGFVDLYRNQPRMEISQESAFEYGKEKKFTPIVIEEKQHQRKPDSYCFRELGW